MTSETFDLRNGKTLNRKTISFDGTLLSESTIKPLFALYDKDRGSLGFKMEEAENKQVKIDVSTIADNVKLALTNKRAKFILVEETSTLRSKYGEELNPNKIQIRYYFQRIYSDKEIKDFESAPAFKKHGKPLSNLITNLHWTLDDNRFPSYYVIDGYYINGASNGMPSGKTLRDYIDTPRYESNIVVKDIIFSGKFI